MQDKAYNPSPSWRLCVAPMIDVTDRHCRFFHRQLAPNALLYTEMITTGALCHGDAARHLYFNEAEHPVALQLGGSEPKDLARSARLGEQWGYKEINLNCGCPSDRVQRGAFGACLMAQPALVADACKAMLDAVSLPVTVKHRLGLDYNDSYSFLRDFIGAQFDVGIRVFIVHARNAVLKGLSPKDNREIPPLRYEVASRLKHDFPQAQFILNGGLNTAEQAFSQIQEFDGVMLGRAAWHTPHVLSELHSLIWPQKRVPVDDEVIQTMVDYAHQEVSRGVPLRFISKAMLGFASGRQGARQWRRMLSDASLLAANRPELIAQAWQVVQ